MIEKSRITCRIIIDHLAKTGGHSVNECIANICYKNAVADGLIGDHENIINSYGGNHVNGGQIPGHRGGVKAGHC